MKIAIFLLTGFVFLFSNIDNLIGDFESEYISAEKKMSQGKAFNRGMITKNKPHKKKMSKMNHMNDMSKVNAMNNMPSIDNDINNQRSSNNKENMLKIIDKEIEEYLNSLMPLVIVIGLFALLVLIMYMMASAVSTSNLKHKISVLENMLSDKSKNIGKNSNQEYDSLVKSIKKINLKISSMESMNQKILKNGKTNISENSQKVTSNQQLQTKNISSEELNIDEFMLDDDFAMDDNEDLNLTSNTRNNKTTKNKKTNLKDMEEFSLDDFNE